MASLAIRGIMKVTSNESVEYVRTVALMTLLIIAVSTSVHYGPSLNVQGQEEDQDEDSDENSDENSEDGSEESPDAGATTSPTSTEGIRAYIDSQGRFRIGYPPDAIIVPLQDLPGGVVSFSSPGVQNITSIDLRVTNMENTDIELEEHVTSILAGLENSSIPNFKPIQTAECETYSLAGEQACTIIYGGDVKTKNNAVLSNGTIMQLYSLLDDNVYNIAFSAPGADFNNNIRILEPMLNSFETLEGQEGLAPVPRFHNFTGQ